MIDRWRQVGAGVIEYWKGLGTFNRVRAIIVVLLGVLALGVLPWRNLDFNLRSFFISILILAGVTVYTIIYAFPAWGRTYSGEIAFGAAIIAYILTPTSTTSREFYSTAAQVVPVLFLALAVEQRAFEVRSSMDESDRHFATMPAVGLLLAGFEAFHALLDEPQNASLQLVTSGLTFGSIALLIRAIAGRRP